MFTGPFLSFAIALFFTSLSTGNSVLHCSTTSSGLSSQTRPYFLRLRSRATSSTSCSFVQSCNCNFFGIPEQFYLCLVGGKHKALRQRWLSPPILLSEYDCSGALDEELNIPEQSYSERSMGGESHR